jgi:hypothetical protein
MSIKKCSIISENGELGWCENCNEWHLLTDVTDKSLADNDVDSEMEEGVNNEIYDLPKENGSLDIDSDSDSLGDIINDLTDLI